LRQHVSSKYRYGFQILRVLANKFHPVTENFCAQSNLINTNSEAQIENKINVNFEGETESASIKTDVQEKANALNVNFGGETESAPINTHVRAQANAISFTGLTKNLTIPGKIAGQQFLFLCDTGASNTIIHSRVYNKFQDKFKLQELDDNYGALRSVNGQDISINGQATIPFEIDNEIYEFKAFIADGVTYDVILGNDFLNVFNAIIDLQKQSISFNQVLPSHNLKENALAATTIHANQTYILPPRSESLILVYLTHPFDPGIT